MFKKEWENSYSSETLQNKNEYPSEEIINFLMHKYSYLNDRSNINILELGCGWGNNLKFLKDKGFSYYGVDFSPTAIEHCKKNHRNVYCCSIHELPFREDFFDVVFDRMALQHNPFNVIENSFFEVRRVLKKGGIFYSILAEEAQYTFETSFLLKSEIKNLAKLFSSNYVETIIRFKEDGKIISKVNILNATK